MAPNNRIVGAAGTPLTKPNVLPTYGPGPLAQPTVITHKQPTGDIEILTLGGLTKAEALAGTIIGHLLTPGVLPPGKACVMDRVGDDPTDIFRKQLASEALDLAEAILAGSEHRAIARAKEKAALNAHGQE